MLKQARHRRIETLPEERRALRANVEATMKEFKAPCRKGKLRTRGLCAASQYAFLRAIGINFGRVYRHLQRLASQPEPSASVPALARGRSAVRSALLAPLRRLIPILATCRPRRITASAAFA